MGTDYGKNNIIRAMRRLVCDSRGDAVVEATVLFPIMALIFAALVLLAIYLPSKAVLQQATQYAATALATEISDTWLYFDAGSMSYRWEKDKHKLANVYAKLFERNAAKVSDKGEIITERAENHAVSLNAEKLTVRSYLVNRIVYKEIIVEASREYKMPVNLSIIGFPEVLTVSASSVAVVQNCDEFIRNMDIATDFAQYAIEKFGLTDIGNSIKEFGGEVKDLLGW